MICFLAKFFIKDYTQVKNAKVRQQYGVLSGAVGIFLNLILFVSKLIAGFITGSISIMADALNNLSDVGSSVVTLVGFRLSGHEADEEHPFGHGRIEYVAGLIVALLIVLMGVELIRTSFGKILNPGEISFNPVVAGILVFAIFIKLVMYLGNKEAAKKIESAALNNTALDSISDVFTTTVVLACAIFTNSTGVVLDGYVGILVGILIVKTGIEAARDTINPLLGEPPSKELVKEIEDTVLSHENILGVHDLVIHNYGPTGLFMSLHAEVDGGLDLITVHDFIDDIENELRVKYSCEVVIHMDPVVIGDEDTERLKRKVRYIVKELDPELKFHDFRLKHSKDKGRRVAFDLSVPYKYNMKDAEILDYLEERIKRMEPDIECDITIDKTEKA
ncbi:cation diffusion facilitator family transporter [Butyrivibrio sp. M55]|uniref:cation diffusion facilitator family transporter n=1 Tax=Butyrivibrio sp. M55 TaxID=1855323 RepID=UPI0008EBC2E2|nr:cation diffusion facilitator family transporter [Butyrivibrio sp. M55]SFU38170.1 cation diffusion facilitator family transporter [Butyrivibrio sp. M55]